MIEKIKPILGDITKIDVDAIVNSANPRLLKGGGVCGAIHQAAGPKLSTDCAALRGCDPGDAKITRGHLLKARHVIHTVGPVYRGGGSGEPELLQSCYKRCFEVAIQHGIRTIAFPSISTGVYGYPIKDASKIALATCKTQLERFPKIQLVYFVLFSRSDLKWYTKHLQDLLGNQEPTWEKLRSFLDELKPNETFLREEEDCRRALLRISELFSGTRAQGTLKELDSLVAMVGSANDRLIHERCSAAVQVLEDKLAHVASLLDKGRARPDFRNKVLKPLQEAKRAIQNETIIADLAGLLAQVDEHFEEAIALIEDKPR